LFWQVLLPCGIGFHYQNIPFFPNYLYFSTFADFSPAASSIDSKNYNHHNHSIDNEIVKQNYPLIFFLPFDNARYNNKTTTSSSFSTGITTINNNKKKILSIFLSENAHQQQLAIKVKS
jgi:hypothetical protein